MKVPDKRTHRLMIRFTEKERGDLDKLAAKAEITPTDYVRTRALDTGLAPNATPAPSVERKMLAEALGKLSDTGAALSDIQLEVSVGDTPLASKVDYALGRIVMASEAILRALGVQR